MAIKQLAYGGPDTASFDTYMNILSSDFTRLKVPICTMRKLPPSVSKPSLNKNQDSARVSQVLFSYAGRR